MAGLGTALTEHQVALLSRYTGAVYLCYDADEAGQKAAQKALRLFENTTLRVKVIHLEGGKDPDEILKKFGAARFKSLLEGAANDVEYRILRARDGIDVTTDDGKNRFLEAACRVLAELRSPVELDIYAARLSEELSVAKDAILAQTRRFAQTRIKHSEKNVLRAAQDVEKKADKVINTVNPERAKHMRAAKAEEVLCASLMHNPEFFSQIKEEITAADFVTSFNARVFSEIAAQLSENRMFSISALSGFAAEEIGAVARIQTLIPQLANTLSECRDCIKVIAEEKAKTVKGSPSELSDEDFLKLFQN